MVGCNGDLDGACGDCGANVGAKVEVVIGPVNMYSGFLDEMDRHEVFCERAGINSCTKFAGTYPSGKSIITSSGTNGRQLIPIFTLYIPRRISSSGLQIL